MSKALATLTCLAVFGFFPQDDEAPTVASMPPVVVETVPRAGSVDVDPDLDEIRVTFSKDMKAGSWSWSTAWKDSSPEMISPPRYDKDDRTCVARVKLEPGRTYGYWLNSQKFGNFVDTEGKSAVPYLLVFQTKGKRSK
jgi:RNA polymerase sigma-70 factor (ECF subfamily)